eukprot:g2965.t1
MSVRGLVVLAALSAGQTHAALLRRGGGREDAAPYDGGTGSSADPAGVTLGGVEDPGAFPASLDRKDSTGMTGPSDTLSTVFDQRRALSDGNSHWNWVHAAHGGSTSVRNELIHARNRGERYFDELRLSLSSHPTSSTGVSATGISATGAAMDATAAGTTGGMMQMSSDVATGPAAREPTDVADEMASEATGGTNDGFATAGATAGATSGASPYAYSSLTGAAAVERGRLAMTGGTAFAKNEKSAAADSWTEEEANEAKENHATGTSLTCVLATGRTNARLLSPDPMWCHSFNGMQGACEKMYVTKPGNGAALCAYDKDNDTCNRGPWSKCKKSTLAASGEAEKKNENGDTAKTFVAVDDALTNAKSLLSPQKGDSKTLAAGILGNRTRSVGNRTRTRRIKKRPPTPEQALNDMENAMDNLANEPATGMAQRKEAMTTFAAERDAERDQDDRGNDLDKDIQTAFADVRHAEAKQLRSTTGSKPSPSRPSSVGGSNIVLAPDDLVTANRKHWAEAKGMTVLPPEWRVANSKA